MSSATDRDPENRPDSAALAERYREPIYRYILRLVRDRARADDLTQETFLRVHQRIDGLKDAGAVEAWLYRIATNLCYDGFRAREYRHPARPLPDDDQPEALRDDETALAPHQLLERREMSDCVFRFLVGLPDSQRQVMLLHDLHEMTTAEIASELGISIENVKIRLHRARVRLKAALAEGCDFDRNDRGVFVCEPRRR